MKQQFAFEKDLEKGTIILSESAETDPGSFMQLHQEEYSLEAMIEAGEKGCDAFVELLRRKNLFPPVDLAVKLFEAAAPFLADEGETKLLMEYADSDSFPVPGKPEEEAEKKDEDGDVDEVVELDALLEVDGDVTEDEIKEIDSDDVNIKFQPDNDSEHEN